MAADPLKKLGKYEIRGTLGKGAMGIVYDGFDPVIERRVAIKTIAGGSMDPDEAAALLSRFRREAQAAGRLNHPGIVSIHDYGEEDGLAFIAMEFIKGSELRKHFESQRRFALDDIVRIMCDILDALDHAHRNGVVHRDIKPANIMITDEGRVKVADFGVARIESSTMTQVGVRIGTPAYMSPEQHQGLEVSGRSDLFSAGVILYEFLTGGRPFTGDGYTIIQKILLQDAIRPSEINADIPRALDMVTMRALAKRPEERFATALEFAEAVRAAATGESIGSSVDFVPNEEALPANGRGGIALPGAWRGASGASEISGSNVSQVALEAELEYWKEIKNSNEAADFETFLQVFPESRFALLARRRMNRLQFEGSASRDADDQGKSVADEQSRIEADKTFIGAAEEEGLPADLDHVKAEAHARVQAEEKRQREEEKTLLLTGDTARAAEGYARKEVVEVRHERETRERAQARAHGKRDWRLPRIDAEEPRLTLRPGSDASDLLPAIDTSPRVRDQFASATFGKVVTGPVHARRRVAKPAPADGGLPFASGASRKPPRLPIVVVLVAVLAASVTWYANRPEVAPFVVALRMQAREILAQLEHEWQARKGQQAEPERKGDEAARLAEEQLKSDEVLTAERTRQSTMARQKEEAARAAAQNYQRAMTLLNQGRSSEAVRLLRQLAHGGHGAAAKTLGDLYSSGEEVLLDRQEASHFYAIAERNGVKVDRSMPSIRR